MNLFMQELQRQNSVQIIQANKTHARSIYALECENFQDPLSLDFIMQELKSNPFAHYYVIDKNEAIIGYIGLRIIDEVAEVMNMAIQKEHQNQGNGTMLLNEVINQAKTMGVKRVILEVRASNERAKELYKKVGFSYMKTRPMYYKNEDAFVYIKEII